MRDRTSLIVACGILLLGVVGVLGIFSESISALISPPPLRAAPDSPAQPSSDGDGSISRT